MESMEEWRSYTTLSSQENRKHMSPLSHSLRFVFPKGNELTDKAVEMITISTLQRKELEKMRSSGIPHGESEEDWLNSLQSWKSKRNSTLERRKDSSRDNIKSSLSDSIEKGRESGIGSSLFSPAGDSVSPPSSNYVLTNYSPAIQPQKEQQKSELDQVLIQLQLLREKKEKREQEDSYAELDHQYSQTMDNLPKYKTMPSRFASPLRPLIAGKTTSTDLHLDIHKTESANVSSTLHYAPRDSENMMRVIPPKMSLYESKKLEKDAMTHDKMKKPTRVVVDIGLNDPLPSSFSHLRSSYRSSTLNPITPPIPEQLSDIYRPSGKSISGGGMRMYGSLPRTRDDDYRVICVDEKRGPERMNQFTTETDIRRTHENGVRNGANRDHQPLLIRNYQVHPITTMDNLPKYKTIDAIDHLPNNTKDNYSTLPSKWSRPVSPPSQGIGRSAQSVKEVMERKEREVELCDGSIRIETMERISKEIVTPVEWLSITQKQKMSTPGLKKNGGNLVRKEFASELNEKIVKKMEAERRNDKEIKEFPQKETNTVSSKKLCAHCGLPLGNGSAMVIGSIDLSFHIQCFRCSECGYSLNENGSEGAKVKLEGGRLKCISCTQKSPFSSYHTFNQ